MALPIRSYLMLVHITLSVYVFAVNQMMHEARAQGKREFFTPRATCPSKLFHVLFRVYLKPYTIHPWV